MSKPADRWPEPAEVEETVALSVAADDSVLGAIRRRRDEFAADQTYDVPVPGYRSLLAIRCGPIGPETQTKTRLKLEKMERTKDPTRDFAINADTLIDVCVEVVGRRHREDEFEPLVPGKTLRLDAGLAEAMQIETDGRARTLVLKLFSGAPSPEVALGVAVNDYLSWAQGVDADTDEDLLGES